MIHNKGFLLDSSVNQCGPNFNVYRENTFSWFGVSESDALDHEGLIVKNHLLFINRVGVGGK